MELVSKYCPEIRKMLFMFERGSCTLSILDSFSKLQDLELWGGAFYTDGLCELLQIIGSRLTHLSLVHVEEIDTRAIAVVTTCCPNLVSFGLQNCEFVEPVNIELDDRDPDGAFRAVDRSARLEEERESRKLLVPMLDLDIVKIVSDCPSHYVQLLLSQCFNVREIFIGMSTGISDDVLFKVISENRLSRLETLTIQNSKKLTMQGIELLLENCHRLKMIKYLENCIKINEFQVKQLKCRVVENNWDLLMEDDCGSVVHDKANFMQKELTARWPPLEEFTV
jgi:hypothetical protein